MTWHWKPAIFSQEPWEILVIIFLLWSWVAGRLQSFDNVHLISQKYIRTTGPTIYEQQILLKMLLSGAFLKK